MDQSFSQQENSIEKQHPKPNPENYTQSKPVNTSDYDPSISKSNSNFHKTFPTAQEQSNKASSNLNYSGNSTETQVIKQGPKVKNELDAVPEISVEYSQITNKTTQLDEIFKGRPEYDNEDRNLTKSKRNATKGFYNYQPHSANTSKSLDFKMESDIQNGIAKHYISPTHKTSTEEDRISKYRENKEKRLARESITTSKHNFTTIYDRPSQIEKDNPIYKSSHLDTNLRSSESMSKLSKSDFQSRDFRGSMSFQGQELKEIIKLKDENERLTERLRIREKELQESKKHNDEFYKKYRDIQNDLNNYQKEKETLLAEKVRLVQLEHREAAARKEAEELRQADAQKNKVIRDLQAQVSSLKADITFMNQKSEAKMEALRLEGHRLEEENSRLMQSMRKSETKRENLIHQLEMSYDEEKLSLRKQLQESVSQLQMVTNRNDDLAHKINKMNKENLKRERAYLEKMDESAYENKKVLEEQILQIKEEVSQQFQAKLHSLQGKVSRLSSENENLKLELQSKPSLRKFKEYEVKIHTLENELENAKEHVHHAHGQEHRKKPSEVGLPAKILKELAEELDVESIGEILPKLKDIKQEHKTDSKLVNSFLELVHKCSPPGHFERRPTHKQAWAWVKDIMEEYMALRKHEEGSKVDTKRDILGTVMDFLHTKDVNEVPGKLSQILGENIGMNRILAKVKILHKLEWVNSLNELEQRIQMEINNTKYEDPYLRSSYYKRNNS